MVAIEAGAEDIEEGESTIDVITPPSDFDRVREAIEHAGITLCPGSSYHAS